jgi:Na+-transporting NADH:ubiquinone oxidoreductase subunit D
LLILGTVREIFGRGTWFGFPVLPTVSNDGWYIPNGLLLLPPSAFFLIAFIIWGLRSWKKNQVEVAEFKIAPNSRVVPEAC